MTFLLLLYYFFPKIDLITIATSATGIRFSDLLCVLFLFKFLADCHKYFINLYNIRSFVLVVFFCASSVSVYNSFLNGFGYMGIIVIARYVQYILVGYYTYVYFVRMNYTKILFIYAISLLMALMQFLEIIPNYNPGKNGFLYSSEFSFSFATPAEFAYFFALLPFLFRTKKAKRIGAVVILINAFNGVKAAIAMVIPVMFSSKRLFYIILLIIFSIAIIGWRIDELNRFFSDILYYFYGNYHYTELKAFRETGYSFASLGNRVGKWGIALSLVLGSLWSFLFGYGLYAAKGALDGGLIRLFFEHGIIGVFCVSYYVTSVGVSYILIFLISNLMFDAYLSSVASPLLIAIYFKALSEYRARDEI